MNHTPTRGDTITLAGQLQTLECVVLRLDAHDELVAALRKYESAFDGLFTQCLSNPISDAWGRQVNTTLLNEAHSATRAALAKVQA